MLCLWPAALLAAEEPPPLTADQCAAEALRHSPRLEAARQELAAQRAAAGRDRPRFGPEVTAEFAQNLHVPRVRADLANGLETIEPLARTQIGVSISQTILHAGGRAATRRADALTTAAEAAAEQTRADVALDARKAYYNALAAERMLAVAEQGLQLAQAHHKLVETMLEGGTAARSDLLRADVDVAEAMHGKLKAENGVALARAALNRAMGRDMDAPLTLAPAPALPPEPAALPELVAAAAQSRPELQALRAQIAAAEAGVSLARVENKPSVSATASLSQQTSSAFVPPTLLAAGVVVRWPFLDGGRAKMDTQEASARVAQLRALLADAESGVALEVRQAWTALREARERAQVEEKNVAAALEAADIAELRFQAGEALQLEAIDARLALQRARADQAQALADAQVAAADLDHKTGVRP